MARSSVHFALSTEYGKAVANMTKPPPPLTPDGRYLVVRGRLWRRANPGLTDTARQTLVDALMDGRRAVRDALRAGEDDTLRAARATVDAAKRGLGERGPVWWTDDAPDENRRLAKNTPYADWWHTQETEPMTTNDERPTYRAERLRWEDELLGEIALPASPLRMTRGLGSGLGRRAGDPPGTFWAVGDRGPNFKIKTAVKRYGVEALRALRDIDGAKVMPALEHGPALTQLQIDDNTVTLVRTLAILAPNGQPICGLPMPAHGETEKETIFALDARPLGTHPSGLDSEGVAPLADGGFWIGDEYGPSLLRLDADGRVIVRWFPAGHTTSGEREHPCLPALAAARRLNRGFEAIALSPDERQLYLAFQSPLAHPNRAAHDTSRNVRLWQLDAATGALDAEYLYRLDPPSAFRRDMAAGEFAQNDVKVSELAILDSGRLLVLERGSASTKLYSVNLDGPTPLPFRDPHTRPTLEQMDEPALQAAGVVPLVKTLVLDTDRAPELPADLEGAVLLSPTELLLVNDNDFGVEGVETEFWRITFDTPIA